MAKHLLSHLQQSDILKILDKIMSTALMAAAVAVRSVGLIFIVGDETQAGPAPTSEAGTMSEMPGAAPLQSWQRQSYRRQT